MTPCHETLSYRQGQSWRVLFENRSSRPLFVDLTTSSVTLSFPVCRSDPNGSRRLGTQRIHSTGSHDEACADSRQEWPFGRGHIWHGFRGESAQSSWCGGVFLGSQGAGTSESWVLRRSIDGSARGRPRSLELASALGPGMGARGADADENLCFRRGFSRRSQISEVPSRDSQKRLRRESPRRKHKFSSTPVPRAPISGPNAERPPLPDFGPAAPGAP